MRSSITFRNIKIRDRELSLYAYKRLVTLWRRCAREFFVEAARHVVIDTGMSYASMLPMAAKVRAAKLLQERLSAEAGWPKQGWTDIEGNYHSYTLKSPTRGIMEAEKSDSKISFGTPDSPQFEFRFVIAVFQFAIHEHGLAGGPAWRAMEHGREKFLETWHEYLHVYVSNAELYDILLNGNTSRAILRTNQDA